ncbi:MAG: thiamine pyrophosphate-binding protein [Endomicrobium sp.]|jgi:acetolactate synthase-1/2/3 large subunit|nr:thiamine pyrophosphate-binding protein [Endomicrobium sp.]
MTTVSEYIFDFLQKKGINTVFMVSGSSAMWLTDALKRKDNLKAICNQHEQVCVMSADIYGRLNNTPGVALVTIGPGATNAITGVAGAWTDSSPLIVLSGNASSKLLKYEQDTAIRQHGTQSLDLSNIVSHITKYFAVIMQPEETRYHVERAYFEAMEGRRGPVWLDVPVDIQNKQVPENMERFTPPVTNYEIIDTVTINRLLSNSKKPLIIAGGGATQNEITTLSHTFSIPVVTSRMGIDNIVSSDSLFVGRPGAYGDRASHFAIQQCDLLLILGCRLSVSTIGYYPVRLGLNAIKVQVDVDAKELAKTDVPVDYKFCTTVGKFVEAVKNIKLDLNLKEWIEHCTEMRVKYPVVLEEYKNRNPLNAYYFTHLLSELVPDNTVITVDTGSVSNIVSQTWNLKKGQRYFISGGLACMGFWAGAIGCLDKPAIALTGDGACAMNIQEFATLKYYRLPIKVFVYQNNGYMLIRHNQHNYMNDRFLGVGPDSGVQTPDYCKVAGAFGLPSVRIHADDDIQNKINEVLTTKGPVICEVMLENFGEISPRIASRVMPDGSLKACEFDDLFPFL